MKDEYFSKRVYEAGWNRNEYFAAHGDIDNFWIDLAYYCNRDDYDALKNPRGHILDFDILDGDGNKIFQDLSADMLSTLEKRGYKLLDQTAEVVGDDGDLYRVTETYGYAPDTTYVTPDWDTVKIFAMEDNDFATSSPVVQDSENATIQSDFYHHIILKVEDSSKFKVGDSVMVHFKCKFGQRDPDGIQGDTYYYDAWADSGLTEIIFIDQEKNLIELDLNTSSYSLDDIYHDSSKYSNHHIKDTNEFWRWIKGGEISSNHNLTLFPTSATLMRGYAYREARSRLRQIRKSISYHESEPTPPDILTPMKEAGGEADIISRSSIPSNNEWKDKVSAGDWYVYKAPEVERDEKTGIYRMTVREAPCE